MQYGLTSWIGGTICQLAFLVDLLNGSFQLLWLMHWLCDAIWWQIWVIIGSGNGLVPDGTKPLPEPMGYVDCQTWLWAVANILVPSHEVKAYVKFKHHDMKSVDVRSSDELQWLDSRIGHQHSSTNNGHQGYLSYESVCIIFGMEFISMAEIIIVLKNFIALYIYYNQLIFNHNTWLGVWISMLQNSPLTLYHSLHFPCPLLSCQSPWLSSCVLLAFLALWPISSLPSSPRFLPRCNFLEPRQLCWRLASFQSVNICAAAGPSRLGPK